MQKKVRMTEEVRELLRYKFLFNLSIPLIARQLKVSESTAMRWFLRRTSPSPLCLEKIRQFNRVIHEIAEAKHG